MKRIIALALWVALLASCGTARKVQQAKQESRIDSVTAVRSAEHVTERSVDTPRTEHGKITITEVVFFPPDTPASNMAGKDGGIRPADIDLPNADKVKGEVKAIRQTMIKTDVQEKGESEEKEESKEAENTATLTRNEEASRVIQEPTPDPYRQRYTFYMSLIVVVTLLYLKHVPILNWIKKILSGLRKIS